MERQIHGSGTYNKGHYLGTPMKYLHKFRVSRFKMAAISGLRAIRSVQLRPAMALMKVLALNLIILNQRETLFYVSCYFFLIYHVNFNTKFSSELLPEQTWRKRLHNEKYFLFIWLFFYLLSTISSKYRKTKRLSGLILANISSQMRELFLIWCIF